MNFTTIPLFHDQYKSIIKKNINIPLHTWIISASGLKTPGNAIKVWLNVVKTDNEEEKRTFIIVGHNNEESVTESQLDNFMLVNSIDIDGETYSVLEVLKMN